MSDKFYEEKEKWARELRRKEADWDFINIEVNLNEGLAYIEINDKINLNKIEREIREKINNTGYVTGQIRELEE